MGFDLESRFSQPVTRPDSPNLVTIVSGGSFFTQALFRRHLVGRWHSLPRDLQHGDVFAQCINGVLKSQIDAVIFTERDQVSGDTGCRAASGSAPGPAADAGMGKRDDSDGWLAAISASMKGKPRSGAWSVLELFTHCRLPCHVGCAGLSAKIKDFPANSPRENAFEAWPRAIRLRGRHQKKRHRPRSGDVMLK